MDSQAQHRVKFHLKFSGMTLNVSDVTQCMLYKSLLAFGVSMDLSGSRSEEWGQMEMGGDWERGKDDCMGNGNGDEAG